MRFGHIVLAFASVCIWAAALAAPARAELLITIDKSSQRMTVDIDGSTRYVWPVSTGAPGYDTPSGQFKPFRMEVDHFSKEWDDAPMPHSIFFTMQGHAIHGSNHTKAIGTPASHGCVRLEPANAAALFALVKQQKMANTQVVLTGETPTSRDAPVARRAPSRDRDYQRSYSNDDYDTTAAVPQRRVRQGRIIRDELGRQFIVYDDLPPRYSYDRGNYYYAPRRYGGRDLFGLPFGR